MICVCCKDWHHGNGPLCHRCAGTPMWLWMVLIALTMTGLHFFSEAF